MNTDQAADMVRQWGTPENLKQSKIEPGFKRFAEMNTQEAGELRHYCDLYHDWTTYLRRQRLAQQEAEAAEKRRKEGC